MPWYKAGTVTVTKGSPDIAGFGTTWGDGAITPGDSFSLVDVNGAAIAPHYEVMSVADDTHLTLKTNYGGATASGAKYAIWNLAGESTAAYLCSLVSALVQRCKTVLSDVTGYVTAAETAATAAASARDDAQTAKNTAETASGTATQAATAAIAAQVNNEIAVAAQAGAEEARDAAVFAQTAAENAQVGAGTSKTAAEAARDAAVAAKTAAESAKTDAVSAKTVTEAASGTAVAAKNAAAASQFAAATSAAAAATAQTAAADSANEATAALSGKIAYAFGSFRISDSGHLICDYYGATSDDMAIRDNGHLTLITQEA